MLNSNKYNKIFLIYTELLTLKVNKERKKKYDKASCYAKARRITMNFEKLKEKYNEENINVSEIDCFLPVHLNINKKENKRVKIMPISWKVVGKYPERFIKEEE